MDETKMAEVVFNTCLESTSDTRPESLAQSAPTWVPLALGR